MIFYHYIDGPTMPYTRTAIPLRYIATGEGHVMYGVMYGVESFSPTLS